MAEFQENAHLKDILLSTSLLEIISEMEDIIKNSVNHHLLEAADSDEEDDVLEVLKLIKECESLTQV